MCGAAGSSGPAAELGGTCSTVETCCLTTERDRITERNESWNKVRLFEVFHSFKRGKLKEDKVST